MRFEDFRLGVCPIGKVLFDAEDTRIQKAKVTSKLDSLGINCVNIDAAVPDGIIRTMDQVEPAVKALRAQNASALFIPHCNFGTEGAAGQIAGQMKLPTLLWAPRDEAPLSDGSRLRDSLCGCFATARVLALLNVDYAYIENCSPDDQAFVRGMDRFLRAARGVWALKHARVGMLGVRVPFFWCTINDEASMLKRVGGSVQTFDMVRFLAETDAAYAAGKSRYREEIGGMTWLKHDNIPEEGLLKSLAMRDTMLKLAQQYKLDAWAVQFFDSLQEHIGAGAGLGLAMVEDTMPCTTETDVTGAFSSVLMEGVAGSTSFFPEYVIRHPDKDDQVCLWHASAPLSLKHPDCKDMYIKEPWILRGSPATSLQFFLREGPVTLGRFDGIGGEFALGFGEGESVKGPATREVYTWLKVQDWPRWERRMIEHAFIHHTSAVYGHYADALELAGRFLKVPVVRFDREKG